MLSSILGLCSDHANYNEHDAIMMFIMARKILVRITKCSNVENLDAEIQNVQQFLNRESSEVGLVS